MAAQPWKTHFVPKAKLTDYRSFLKWELVLTLEKLKELLTGKKLFSFDTETTGLDYNKLRLTGFSFSTDGFTGYYVPIGHKVGENAPRECLDYIVSLICDDTNTVLAFNKKYDLNVLEVCENYNLGVRFNVKDVQAYVYLIDTEYTMPSLKWSSEHFLGIVQPRYDETVGQLTFDYANAVDIVEYAGIDACATYLVGKYCVDTFPDLLNIFDIDNKSVEAIRIFERHKIRLDREWLIVEEEKVTAQIKELEKEVFAAVGYEFNLNSDMQKADALLRSGCTLTVKTEKGKWSTSEEVLSSLQHPIAKLMVKHSKLSTYLSNFLSNLIKYSAEDGRIRFNYKTCSTVTGRFSSGGDAKNSWYAGLNAQNMPKPEQVLVAVVPDESSITGWKQLPLKSLKLTGLTEYFDFDEDGHIINIKLDSKEVYICETGDAELRQSFLPDDDDSVWASIDYSGQELRIAANFSNEPVFVSSYKEGRDPHMETAKAIWGKEANKNHRRMAKGANFALQYGGNAFTLQTNLGITKEEADSFYDKYKGTMRTLIDWQNYMKRKARRDGVVYSAFGRPFRLGRFFTSVSSRKQQAAGERYALNYPIQGSGGDIIRIKVVDFLSFFVAMRKAGVKGCNFLSTVHDEINYSVKKDFLHKFMEYVPGLMRIEMDNWAVPLEVDVSIGDNWGFVIPYKYDKASKKFTPKGDKVEIKH